MCRRQGELLIYEMAVTWFEFLQTLWLKNIVCCAFFLVFFGPAATGNGGEDVGTDVLS